MNPERGRSRSIITARTRVIDSASKHMEKIFLRAIPKWIFCSRAGSVPNDSYRKWVIDPVEQVATFVCMKSLALIVLLTSAALGQTTKTGIAIHCVALPGDVVGGQLCTALRLAVARNPRYEEAVTNPQGWQLRLATMGIDDNKGAAVSMTLVYRAMYVVNTVQVCGASVIADCAQGMLSDSDDHIRLFETAVKDRIAKQQTP